MSKPWLQHLVRLAALVLLTLLALQLFFALRIAAMVWVDPQSTSFQRSEAWRLFGQQHTPAWRQQWVPGERISTHLKRAVIASEDAAFADHTGVDWEALERAWERNQRAEALADRRNEQLARRPAGAAPATPVRAKLVGGSTITQQLAKNLFLSSERTALRKTQELALTFILEAVLSKRRILEVYLNHVEWGEAVFGAQAAARHYFRIDASQLAEFPAARLAVMLPAPKRFEKRPASPYVSDRAATVVARMASVELP